MQATAPTLAVLAEDELERGAGGFQRCDALQTFRDTEPRVEAERSEEGRELPIQRPREAMTVALPVISFEVDWGAAQQRVDNGQEKGELRGVLCRKGQAHRLDTGEQRRTRAYGEKKKHYGIALSLLDLSLLQLAPGPGVHVQADGCQGYVDQ